MLIRLDSFLSKYGVCSRRRAKILIESGTVRINGALVKDVTKIDTNTDSVSVNEEIVNPKNLNYRYIIFYKPLNVLSTTHDEHGRKTVLDYVKIPERVYPVGRLDYNSTGLVLLTNDGDFALKITHPRYDVPKRYLVETSQKIMQNQLSKMEKGVEIYGTITKPVITKQLGDISFEITLHQGLKRQIREMCKAVGLEVVSLKRTHIGALGLGGMKPGEYRDLNEKELRLLNVIPPVRV
jgi:23S rRNA pseudouridine2605 synthase